MPEGVAAIVVFGDIVGSRRAAAASTAFLRTLAADLNSLYPSPLCLAAPGLTQGDELQILLAPSADPFAGILRAALRVDALQLRWVVVGGDVDRGSGPTTERTGDAFLRARALLDRTKLVRDLLAAETGDPETDGLLADLAPALPRLLADLTPRQREVARLLLVDGLRRAEAAERMGISRATVSVMAERARVREIGGLARGLAGLFARGVARAAPVPEGAPA